MSLVTTILAAIVIMALVVLALLSGYLITGKIRLKKRCGMTPEKKDGSCPLCGSSKSCDEKEEKK